MLILIGPGIHGLIERSSLPQTGDIITLGSPLRTPGQYRLIDKGRMNWRKTEFPYFEVEYLGEIPDGQKPESCSILNC